MSLVPLLGAEPTAPPGLAERLRAHAENAVATHAALAAAGRVRLNEAIARPGRVRESAFTLLEADALLTYACEAALDAEDSEGAILDVLATTSG